MKIDKLIKTAKEKEDVRRKLAIVAKQLAKTAKEKEEVRRKLLVTAQKLAKTAKEKEDVRRKLAVTAKQQNQISSKLKVSEIRYRRLFETAHDGILILDSENGQITDVNPFLERLLGYSKKEFLEKKLWEVGAFRNMKAAKDVFKILQKDGFVRYDDLPLETKEGQLVSVEFVSNSYMAGGTLVIQCNIRDITERKKVDLIRETRRLLEEERLKVESIADSTHELRTPLAIMKGNVDLAMLRGGKSPRSALTAINYEIKHLSGILADLSLITSKAWELKNRIQYRKVSIKSIVKVVMDRSTALAYKKNISVSATKIPDVTIVGDKVYLEKMLMNLVKNSIIYGRRNGRTIISAKKSHGHIEISVKDNGIGISYEDISHVFERFYRADKYHSSGGNSIGLGLAIVKWIAEVHGGTASVRSAGKQKGSTFTITLPMKTTIKTK